MCVLSCECGFVIVGETIVPGERERQGIKDLPSLGLMPRSGRSLRETLGVWSQGGPSSETRSVEARLEGDRKPRVLSGGLVGEFP